MIHVRQEVTTSPSLLNSEHCTAYNNFVRFIENIKHLDLYGTLSSIPNSIASLLTFLSTLLGSRLIQQVKQRPSSTATKSRPILRPSYQKPPI